MARNILVTVVVAILVSASSAGAAALITGAQIKNNTVTGKDVKNKSLTKKDFRGSARGLRGFQGPQGPQGPKGDTGPQGLQGPQGPAGATNVVIRTTGGSGGSTPAAPDGEATEILECLARERAVGGGFRQVDAGGDPRDFIVTDSLPHPLTNRGGETATGWRVTVFNADHNNDDDGEVRFRTYVVCAAP